MPTDNRISTLPEINLLYSDIDLLDPLTGANSNADADVLFLITKSGVKNEKITFKNLKSSILGNTVSLTGAQTISGEKTFADICTFQDTVFLNEVVDTTVEGDISGYNFVATTGRFEKLGIGSGFADKTREPEYDLHVEGDVCIEGEFNALGEIQFGGNLGLNDVTVSGDLFVGGSGIFDSGIHVSGDANFSGNFEVAGTGNFSGEFNVSGDIGVGNKIFHVGDEDTFIQFEQDTVTLQAGTSKVEISDQQLDMVVDGDRKFFVDDQGRLAINTNDVLGDLSMSGDAYVEKLYVTGQHGAWEQLVPKGYDESVHFSTNLIGGQTTYEIDFPKTFGSTPIVHATISNNGAGGVVFFNISNITNSSYFISFNSPLVGNDYSVETQATSSSDYSLHQTTTQSFRDQIIEGDAEYTITFPDAFTKKPVVSVSLERKISYSISDPGTPGETFVDGWEYYIATATDTWRRVTMAAIPRTVGSEGDTDFDSDFYYVWIYDNIWGKIPLATSSKTITGTETEGDVEYSNNFLYVFTDSQWKESAIATWISESSATIIPYMISDITETSFQINFASPLGSQYFVHAIASR